MRPLPQSQYKILEHLASGGLLVARRAFPYPHKYRLVRSADEIIEGKTPEVSPGTLQGLIGKGLLRPVKGDDMWDNYSYALTPKGQETYDSGAAAAPAPRGAE
jgi:hypothetical protein